VTLSVALTDCLVDLKMTKRGLAKCIYDSGFPRTFGNVTEQNVRDEITFILANSSLRLPDPFLREFCLRMLKCLAKSDPALFHDLKSELAAVILANALGGNGPPPPPPTPPPNPNNPP
jgi:hypothetical protein